MIVRTDIAELLHAGVPHLDIARQLHVSRKTVSAAHRVLRLPDPVRGGGSPYTSLEAAFHAHAEPGPDGHVRWSGCVDGGVPRVCYRGRRIPALRVAFRLHHGRAPEGRLTRTCDLPGCVAGAHCADRPMREAARQADRARQAADRRADKAFAQIFGEAA